MRTKIDHKETKTRQGRTFLAGRQSRNGLVTSMDSVPQSPGSSPNYLCAASDTDLGTYTGQKIIYHKG